MHLGGFYLEIQDEVTRYRVGREISVKGRGVPYPVTTFLETNFPGTERATYLTAYLALYQIIS